MQNLTLRTIGKINSNVVQNSRRLFSFKFEMTPANRLASEQAEETKPAPPEEASKFATNFRYNVCQPRTSPIDKPKMAGDSVTIQKENVKAAIEEQHLQPSMLPEYYQRQMERNALINPGPENTEEVRINQSQQRKFQVSKTYANATLPLKSVKLANPFPEPVKMMMSRTVSDDEKAEQMLAESKSQRQFTEWNKSSVKNISSSVRRWYSKQVGSDPDKCKKIGKNQKGGCPKLSVKHCPPRARTKCDRQAKEIHCKKQEAPYPAYSEFCHEEIDEKPSSCKICPWKADENPNFKPQKKKFHTSNVMDVNKRRGLEIEATGNEKVPEDAASPATEEAAEEGMLCDLRKPACERPKNRRCPPTKEELKKKERERKKKEQQKKDCISADEILEETIVPTQQVQNLLSLRGKDKQKDPKKGPCKIKKFRFPKCEPIKRQGEASTGRCPPKKKKPQIIDCPGENEKCNMATEEIVEEYQLSRSRKSNEDDTRRCPKIELPVFKEDEDNEDPCKLKRKGTTKICPADLLKKKRRKPGKKTSGVIAPSEPNKQEPQRPRLTKTI